jgi:ABC-type glutathione transport system ATPase component
MTDAAPLLHVEHLKVAYPIRSSVLLRKTGENVAVSDVHFDLSAGQTVGLVGESGSGKSTVARTVIGLVKPTAGRVVFQGQDITEYSPRQLKDVRRQMQMIFQDPYASLNPRLTVRDIIAEGWRVHSGLVPRSRWTAEAKELLERVGLNPDYSDRYPHQFSGGQRQRIGIARALALKPKLIICDEAVSALDVSVQAQVLNLLDDLQRELQLAYLFISHDLSVIEHICDRVLVLNGGVVVEEGTAVDLFRNPQDAYTKRLLAAVPVVRPWLDAAP